MKKIKYFKLIILTIILSMVSLSSLPFSYAEAAEATEIKINKKILNLEPGQTDTLIISGTKQKITWSTSNNEVATVNKSGKVTAVKEGVAIIKATVVKKKLTCSVTVKQNPYITNAPFEAQVVKNDYFQYVIPKNWTSTDSDSEKPNNSSGKKIEEGTSILSPKIETGEEEYSIVELMYEETDNSFDVSDYDGIKEILNSYMTEEYVKEMITQGLIDEGDITKDTNVTYSDFITSDFTTPLGTALKYEFNMKYDRYKIYVYFYFLFTENYSIMVASLDGVDILAPDMIEISPNAKEVSEYVLKSLYNIDED